MNAPMDEILKLIPEKGSSVWYWDFDEKSRTPECLVSRFQGVSIETIIFPGEEHLRKVARFYLRNDDHSQMFTVPKIWPTREDAIASIGGHIFGKYTELHPLANIPGNPNSAA